MVTAADLLSSLRQTSYYLGTFPLKGMALRIRFVQLDDTTTACLFLSRVDFDSLAFFAGYDRPVRYSTMLTSIDSSHIAFSTIHDVFFFYFFGSEMGEAFMIYAKQR